MSYFLQNEKTSQRRFYKFLRKAGAYFFFAAAFFGAAFFAAAFLGAAAFFAAGFLAVVFFFAVELAFAISSFLVKKNSN